MPTEAVEQIHTDEILVPEVHTTEGGVKPQYVEVENDTTETPQVSVEPVTTTQSGREVSPPARLNEYVVYCTNIKEMHPDIEFLQPYEYSETANAVIALAASSDPGTLYFMRGQ
jgi:hypothetical protein